jgi:thymidine phosphorylase
MNLHLHALKVKDIGIDTYQENIIYMLADCHVCRSEGFSALARVVVHTNGFEIIATLNVVHNPNLLAQGEVGLSIEAMKRLGVKEGDTIIVSHLRPIQSISKVRAKMYGKELDLQDFEAILKDIVAGRYSNIELAAFIAACAGNKLTLMEIMALTQSMISVGQKLDWGKRLVLDKHCVGGLPGNRTSPIVVSIVAAAGFCIPKTSSRAITSPAGTADTMETMAPVNLSMEQIKQVVDKEGGCIVWGGAVKLSPADDILIAVEKALDVDSEGQMIASVLSKKAAAGSTHVVIDIPVGPTAKVRSQHEAQKLQAYFIAVGQAIGITAKIIISDGSQPVGRGIGPALEAIDVLGVLRNEDEAPQDLKAHAIALAGSLLEMSGNYAPGLGIVEAIRLLESGLAYQKFMAICLAQGGFTEPVLGKFRFDVLSETAGIVKSVDNRAIAKVAKLAGAPKAHGAGVYYLAPLGRRIAKGDLLYTIFSESKGELDYALAYLQEVSNMISIV